MATNLVITTDALKPPLTGIGYYTLNLLRELLRLPEVAQIEGLGLDGFSDREQLAALVTALDSGMTATDYHHASLRHRLVGNAKALASQLPGAAMALRRLYLRRCGDKMRTRPDHILHAPNFIPPPFAGRTVITVHDLSHIRHPETHPRERVIWLNQQLPRALIQADRIICVSEFTRRELLELGLVKDENRLRVCLNGLDAGFHPRPAEAIAGTLAVWGLRTNGYLLSVATLEPRKNLAALLEAYRLLPPELAADFPLVLTGASGWHNSELADSIARLPATHRVITTGYVDRTRLQHLLSGAALFGYLSIYEGFGLPVLEAMASGAPVLMSATPALTEVAGDAALAMPPRDPVTIAEAMIRLLTDAHLAHSLRDRGIARAAQFSWQRCAQDTARVYRELQP